MFMRFEATLKHKRKNRLKLTLAFAIRGVYVNVFVSGVSFSSLVVLDGAVVPSLGFDLVLKRGLASFPLRGVG